MGCRTVNNKGQTIIEATFAITFLVIALSGIITVIYLYSLKTWMIHVAYEGTICLAQEKAPSECENKMKNQIKILNFRHAASHSKSDYPQLPSFEYLDFLKSGVNAQRLEKAVVQQANFLELLMPILV